ncbi:MAG: hypothetical protein R3E12_13690 [Candidatus Eisenbacteria bacterium]
MARNEIARLRVQEMLRHYDFHDIVALLDDMAATRRLDPTNAQTLYLESYLDYLATRNPDADRLALSRQGCSRLDELLATSPGSVDAKLLRAVHLTELRLWDEADLQFRTAIDSLPPDRRRCSNRSRRSRTRR